VRLWGKNEDIIQHGYRPIAEGPPPNQPPPKPADSKRAVQGFMPGGCTHDPLGGGCGCSPPRASDLNDYAQECHREAYKWHHTPEGEKIERNKGEMLMLIVSEIAEAMEGERKDLMDDKIPYRKMVEVELADALIRIFDYAGANGYDLEGAYQDKLEYNRVREDHSYEHRAGPGGKKF